MNNEENTRQKKDFLIREWFLLTVIVGGLCLYKLAAVGEASLHSVLFGYSPARILMMAVLTAGILIGLTGLITGRFSEWIITISEKRLSASIAAVLFFMLSIFWIFLGFLSEERLHPYFERLQPLLLYGIFISGTSVLLFFKLRNQEIESPGEHAAIRKQATVIFYIAFALYLFIRITGVGIVPDEMDWQPNGMAIQYWELLLSLWFALALSVLLRLFRMQHKNNLTTVILFLSVWAAAAFLWVSIPTMKVLDHSYFMEITEPNQLPYPASDAAYYGLWAESILAGLGFKTTVVTRQFSLRGLEVVSAFNISSTISNLFFCAFLAMGNAIGIIVGQILGSGDLERAVDEDRKLIAFSVALSVAVGLLMALIAPLLPRIYNTTDVVKALAVKLLQVGAVMMPVYAYANSCYFTLRSGGKTVVTFVFDSLFTWMLCVPVAFVLSRYTAMPILPMYITVELLNLIKCVIGYFMVKHRRWVVNLVGESKA